VALLSFQTHVLPCIIMLKQVFCQIPLMLQSFEKLLYFLLTPESGGGVDFRATPPRIHNNQLFTVPEESNRSLTEDF
jgi:hypothetical protein